MIMLQNSSSISSVIFCAARSSSKSVMSLPPVMFTSRPFADLIVSSPSSGFVSASTAALIALSSPSACPDPMIAFPVDFITLVTSAKSRLIRPGSTMRSVTLRTPPRSTSSAKRKALSRLVFSSIKWKRFWLGTTISESVTCCISSRPSCASRARCLPSNVKGCVATPTVSMLASRQASAITGAAPVPVPPPMPAVMKTMCDPSSTSMISGSDSSAASLPASGFAPHPRPWVVALPIWIRLSVRQVARCCASVFATTKSTPLSPLAIMLLTALPPAPPTPITVRVGLNSWMCPRFGGGVIGGGVTLPSREPPPTAPLGSTVVVADAEAAAGLVSVLVVVAAAAPVLAEASENRRADTPRRATGGRRVARIVLCLRSSFESAERSGLWQLSD
mmetsp:Transcript_22273/g.56862  ORF Transcript_22273/g.56862 Transcript_22273/m.56862 type:complete len:391 (-) Transcript_22273:83-1255(-)